MDFIRIAVSFVKSCRAPVIMAVIAAAFFLLNFTGVKGFGPAAGDDRPFSIDEVRLLFPGAAEFEREDGLYSALGDDGSRLGFFAYGPPERYGITGYAGRVPVLIGMDSDRRITEVRMLPNRETPSYASMVSEGLAGSWTGLTPREAMTKEVDALTGATQTSEALITGVRKTMRSVFDDPYADVIFESGSLFKVISDALVVGVLALGLLYFFSSYSSRKISFILKCLCVLIPGVLAASLLSLAIFEGWLRGNISLQRHWLLIAVALPALGIPLLRGRNFYCYNFCPYGAAQDLIGRINKKKLRPGKKLNMALGGIRKLLLAGALFMVVLDIGPGVNLIEPFAAFRWQFAHTFTRVLAAAFLVLAVWIPRPWCRICPTGGLIDGLKGKRTKESSPRA